MYIGTLVVVKNWAVIERHSKVRVVIAKDIIPSAQILRKIFRQKQCDPAPNHDLIFFESTSWKNSETSYLWIRWHALGMDLINALINYTATSQYNRCDQEFETQYLNGINPQSTQNNAILLAYAYVLMHALPGIVDGARKTSQVGRRAWGGGRRFSSLSMLDTTVNRDQRKHNANKNLGLLNLQRGSPAFIIDLTSNLQNSGHFLNFVSAGGAISSHSWQ